MLAELQYQLIKQGSGRQSNPLIGRIETNAGHGGGKPTSKIIEEYADMLAFAAGACRGVLKQ
jgi:prolyl oligopeptidase